MQRVFPFPCITLVGAFLLQGCLYTSHHFNTGRLLEPGRTSVTTGFGMQPYVSPTCSEPYAVLSLNGDKPVCITYNGIADAPPDTAPARLEKLNQSTYSFGYRLGVRGRWGPFTGAEIGWHLEMPTNPASAEFDLKLGLPAPERFKMFHSVSAGWIIGMWEDNSFFAEYAASRALGAHSLFANFRGTYVATQPDDVFESSQNRFGERRRYAWQGAAGFEWRLGDIPILPDYVVPMVAATWPGMPALGGSVAPDEGWQLNFNLGLGWSFR